MFGLVPLFPSPHADAIRTKRSSLVVLRSSVSMEDKGKDTQRSRTTEQDVAAVGSSHEHGRGPCRFHFTAMFLIISDCEQEKALQVSSNTDAEPDGITSSQRTLVYRTRRNDSGPLKRSHQPF